MLLDPRCDEALLDVTETLKTPLNLLFFPTLSSSPSCALLLSQPPRFVFLPLVRFSSLSRLASSSPSSPVFLLSISLSQLCRFSLRRAALILPVAPWLNAVALTSFFARSLSSSRSGMVARGYAEKRMVNSGSMC